MCSTKLNSIILLLFLVVSCKKDGSSELQPEAKTLFTMVPSEQSHVNFKNSVTETFDFNVLKYYYVYNGGGVAIGDVNNDGLQDIYFTSNQQSNKLYLNKGNFEFEDVTAKAGVADMDGWTTGVCMIDINNDGWMDIYVCKSASLSQPKLRKNKLYINQKNGTFKEEAEKWGLDNDGLSVQSYFFDYDKDGDLDMYLINHRNDFFNSINLQKIQQEETDKQFLYETSDHLYRNDGDHFTDVTINAGVQNKEFSLSASIGDFNNDGWLDVFVANDFITPDKLYINNKNGTFSNQLNERILHTSYSSMGSDYADINNDFLPDLMVLDMSAEDHSRGKQNMPSMNTDGFWAIVNAGYNYDYMSNILNLNRGNGAFSDIAQFSGVSKTDWSWAPLIADFDNDGFKDIFVTNGIKREIANQDFGHFLDTETDSINHMSIGQVLNAMPSDKLQNYAFRNNGDLTFSKVMDDWGFDMPVNSNGAAYADLDNDGDLDLVINNLDDEAGIYRNNSNNHFVSVVLKGDAKNMNAIGSKVKVFTKDKHQYQELYLSRGYQSSVSPVLTFGLGDANKIDKIEVDWNDGTVSTKTNVDANQTLTFKKSQSKAATPSIVKLPEQFNAVNPNALGIQYQHTENIFNDFSLQVLLPQKQSQQGPAFAVADVNGDGLEDMFLGGANKQAAELYLQTTDGNFVKQTIPAFETDKAYTDQGAHFFDADGDGALDLYVTSGGYELNENDALLQDRLYINSGNGNFTRSGKLPKMLSSTKAVTSIDFDGDGDLDLIVGGRVVPGKYPLSPRSYILENTKQGFVDVTQTKGPEFANVGLVNDILLSDYDNDGHKDVMVVGEWMPITVFKIEDGSFKKQQISAFEGTEGWWNTISEIDFDNDGDMDYFVGNLGGNNKFHPSKEKPLYIYGNNFDSDGKYDMILSKLYHGKEVPVRGKECSTNQNPFVSDKMKTYKEFANATLSDIYGNQMLADSYHEQAHEFESVYIENTGNGTFKVTHLPNLAQLGPTMDFVFTDVNHDGNIDILGSGAIHESEVETVRYDSNTGYVLLGDGKGGLTPSFDNSFYNNHNAKHMKLLQVKGQSYIVVANNDGPLSVFKIKS